MHTILRLQFGLLISLSRMDDKLSITSSWLKWQVQVVLVPHGHRNLVHATFARKE